MADVYGFNDRETAERLKEIASVPQTINRVNTERRKRPAPIGGGAILAVTPTGGIPAMTDTTFPLSFPSATCYRVDPDTGDYFDPPEEVVVFNMVSVAIAGQVLIQAKPVGAKMFVDVDNCSGQTLSLPPFVTAPGA